MYIWYTKWRTINDSKFCFFANNWIKKAECRIIDAFELWCWRRLLRVPWTARRSNQSILKEISPGCSLEGLMLKLKLQYFGHLMWGVGSLEKPLMLGGIGGRRRKGRQWMRWLDGITDSITWVWVNSRSWWWTGRPGVLWFMGSQRVGHDWTTELNWTERYFPNFTYKSSYCKYVHKIFQYKICITLLPKFSILATSELSHCNFPQKDYSSRNLFSTVRINPRRLQNIQNTQVMDSIVSWNRGLSSINGRRSWILYLRTNLIWSNIRYWIILFS